MIHGFPAGASGLDRDGEIFFHFLLADKFRQPLRTQFQLIRGIVPDRGARDQALAVRIGMGMVSGAGH